MANSGHHSVSPYLWLCIDGGAGAGTGSNMMTMRQKYTQHSYRRQNIHRWTSPRRSRSTYEKETHYAHSGGSVDTSHTVSRNMHTMHHDITPEKEKPIAIANAYDDYDYDQLLDCVCTRCLQYDNTQDMFTTTIAGTQTETGKQTSHGTPITPDTYLGNKCHISLNESSADDAVYPLLLPQLDSDNDTNFTLRTKRNTTSTLNHIDNNAQQTQHEPYSGTNYHDTQYNNTANTQDTTKRTHARTPNTKSVETETTHNTKHTKQIYTQTGHKHNALNQSKHTYEVSTNVVSNGLNVMSIPNEKAYVTKKRQNQKQRQQRLTALTDLFRTQKMNKGKRETNKGTLARTSYIWE